MSTVAVFNPEITTLSGWSSNKATLPLLVCMSTFGCGPEQSTSSKVPRMDEGDARVVVRQQCQDGQTASGMA